MLYSILAAGFRFAVKHWYAILKFSTPVYQAIILPSGLLLNALFCLYIKLSRVYSGRTSNQRKTSIFGVFSVEIGIAFAFFFPL